jgi:hypothetical protein
MSVRVVVSGKNLMGKKFSDTCRTIVINAHGGLVHMKQEVADGAMLVVTNPVTQEDLECRVVFLGELGDKGQRVGLEFLTPAPHFWGVEFTQKDWIEPEAKAENSAEERREAGESGQSEPRSEARSSDPRDIDRHSSN